MSVYNKKSRIGIVGNKLPLRMLKAVLTFYFTSGTKLKGSLARHVLCYLCHMERCPGPLGILFKRFTMKLSIHSIMGRKILFPRSYFSRHV